MNDSFESCEVFKYLEKIQVNSHLRKKITRGIHSQFAYECTGITELAISYFRVYSGIL